MPTGIELIAEERKRQVEVEGWTAHHDQEMHSDEEMAMAAVCYATPTDFRHTRVANSSLIPIEWPWNARWWKPTPDDRVRELVKAGALIAAEIDRLNAIK